MSTSLAVANLSYTYPNGKTALDNVSFGLEEGENVALLGPNGSGKTTLLLRVAGLLKGEGTLQLNHGRVEARNPLAKGIGIVFQDPDSQLFMPSVMEDVMFGLLNQGETPSTAERSALASLASVGLDTSYAKLAPFQLSAGEKQRVALAGVLAMSPAILLLDEPTSCLDPLGQRGLVALLKKLTQPKLISTHDPLFAAAVTSRALFLEKGKLVANGPVSEVIRRFNWQYDLL